MSLHCSEGVKVVVEVNSVPPILHLGFEVSEDNSSVTQLLLRRCNYLLAVSRLLLTKLCPPLTRAAPALGNVVTLQTGLQWPGLYGELQCRMSH